VALVSAELVDTSNVDDVQLIADDLQTAYALCPGQAFGQQPSAARCSGTLVGPDLVLTAGQCIDEVACADGSTAFVFDYFMTDAAAREPISAADDVYQCSRILSRQHTGNLDYALVQLDRAVTGRTPASVHLSPLALADGTALYAHGFPLGLPLKLDAGGAVRDGRPSAIDYFVANLDTFTGSSGSGVFAQDTGELVGVVVRGEADFTESGSCLVANGCSDDACAGEDATYAFRAFAYLCGDIVCDPTFENSTLCPQDCNADCGDGVCNGDESPSSCSDDCGTCGNGTCDPGETRDDCLEDCGAACGDDVCDGDIGEDSSNCDDCAAVCGDGACTGDEGVLDDNGNPGCAVDCLCGDLTCDPDIGETPETCCDDCGCPTGLEVCVANECRSRLLTCGDPGAIDISGATIDTGGAPFSTTITGETFGGLREASGTCVTGDAPERVYSLAVTGDTRVEASLTGDFDTTLYLRRACDDDSPDNEVLCDDNGNPAGNGGSYFEQVLSAGDYHLYVDGRDGDSGSFSLTLTVTLQCDDSDGDGVCADTDECVDDPDKSEAGYCGCGNPETNSDNDLVPDCEDACPADSDKVLPGECGCGTPEGECDGCSCVVGEARAPAGLPGALLLALVGLLAVRRPRRGMRVGADA
jgi:MYXO-CTERM domain-containing protein